MLAPALVARSQGWPRRHGGHGGHAPVRGIMPRPDLAHAARRAAAVL